MGFAVPWMLLGLASIAVPVLLHLVERRHLRGRGFPSVMFVRRLEARREKRKTLRDRPLLLLRCLALVFATLAFAGPYVLSRQEAPARVVEHTDRVYLVDASHSMRLGGAWRRAVTAAGNDIDAMGADDRAAIVAFDEEPRIVFAMSADRAGMKATLRDLQPGYGGTGYGAALSAAQALLGDSEAPRREIVLVSDLAMTGAGRPPVVAADLSLRLLPAHRDVEPGAVVTDVGWRAGVDSQDGSRTFFVSVRGSGLDAPAEALVHVTVDGYAVAAHRVSLPVDDVVTFDVDAVTGDDGAARVTVDARLADGGEPGRFFFVAAPRRPVDVLLVGPGETAATGLFVEGALSLATDPPAALTRRTPDSLGVAEMADAEVVVLAGVDPSSAPLPSLLSGHLSRGRGLMVFGGAGFRSWPDDLADALPVTLGPDEIQTARAAGGIFLSADHPWTRSLERALGRDELDVDVHRLRRIVPADERHVLARHADGAPAVVAGDGTSGRVILFATGLEATWSSLARHEGFAPLMIESVRYLAGRSPVPAYFRTRSRVDLRAHLLDVARAGGADAAAPIAGELVLTAPDGRRRTFGDGQRVALLDTPGIHALRESTAGGLAAALAVNVDPAELLGAPLDAETFLAGVSRPSPGVAVNGGAAREPPPRLELWWWMLAAALGLFIAEALLSNRSGGTGGPERREAGAS